MTDNDNVNSGTDTDARNSGQDSSSHDANPQQPESEQGQPEEQNESEEQNVHALLEDARTKADQHYDQLVRLQAEMDNLRKRTRRDLESAHKFALEKISQELLPVRDSMEMGLAAAEQDTADVASIREGVDLTLKMLSSVMDKFGMEQVAPEKGEKLNPDLHQAMSMQDAPDAEPNTVLSVVQKGYTLNGRLLRPAMVIVAKASDTSGQGGGDKKVGSEIDEQA